MKRVPSQGERDRERKKALCVYNNFKIITVPLARCGPPSPDSQYEGNCHNFACILQQLRDSTENGEGRWEKRHKERRKSSRRNRVNCAFKRVALGPQLVDTFYTLCSHLAGCSQLAAVMGASKCRQKVAI